MVAAAASLPRPTRTSFLAGGLLGLVLGAVGGAGGMLIAYPYVFPPPVAADAAPVAKAGAMAGPVFRFDEQAKGRDSVHWANGTGSLVKTDSGWVLRLDANFKAGPGPNFWIYLNTRGVADEAEFNADAGRVRLLPLKSFEGAQNYALPSTIDPAQFHTVTIWCESFGAYIASGKLERPA